MPVLRILLYAGAGMAAYLAVASAIGWYLARCAQPVSPGDEYREWRRRVQVGQRRCRHNGWRHDFRHQRGGVRGE